MIEDTTKNFKEEKLEIEGKWLIDPNSDRVIQFRGVNLGANSKNPNGWDTLDRSTVYDFDSISFVGKPLPIDQAEEHCKRLKYWGMSLIRLLVPWEALEHKGPGKYDEEYINYLIALLNLFKKYKMRCFIDPHQDVWSRFTGGSGAPAWTLYLAGMDPRNFKATTAAISMFDHDPPEEYPCMTWSANYGKLAAATMFTLFFGGEKFAPKCMVNTTNEKEENIQAFLQNCYIEAYKHLFSKIKSENLLHNVVLGLDTMNEPSEGFIEIEDITSLSQSSTFAKILGSPAIIQAFILGSGHPCEVVNYLKADFGYTPKGTRVIDPKGTKAWLEEGTSIIPDLQLPKLQDWQKDGKCIWAMNGVWDPETKEALIPDYFYKDKESNKNYDFLADFWMPFVKKLTTSIREIDQDIVMFVEGTVGKKLPVFKSDMDKRFNRIIYSPHWYDILTLLYHNYKWWTADVIGILRGKYASNLLAVKLGRSAVRKCFVDSVQLYISEGVEAFGETPVVVGETGIPFNMKNNPAFENGDYTEQINALDATFNATEQAGSMCTVWNYTYDNNNQMGDLWNREDLSIFSNDTIESTSNKNNCFNRIPLDKGGRALEAAVRPYAMLTPGYPQKQSFSMASSSSSNAPYFEYIFKAFPASRSLNTNIDLSCKIFLPIHHFPLGQPLNVQVSEGKWELVYEVLDSDNPSYSTSLEEPKLQFLIWKFDCPLQEDKLFHFKVTYEGSAFPSSDSIFPCLC